MVDLEKVQRICKELSKLTMIEDIGYHSVEDDYIIPQFKLATKTLTEETWKEQHKGMKVHISKDTNLKKVVKTKTELIMEEVSECEDNKALNSFNIRSVYVFPVIENNNVVGLYVVASIGKCTSLTEKVISKSKELIERGNN